MQREVLAGFDALKVPQARAELRRQLALRSPRRRSLASNTPETDLAALERRFHRTAVARRLRRRILVLQRRLAPKLDESGWRLYLALEEAFGERQIGLLDYLQRRIVAARRKCSTR